RYLVARTYVKLQIAKTLSDPLPFDIYGKLETSSIRNDTLSYHTHYYLVNKHKNDVSFVGSTSPFFSWHLHFETRHMTQTGLSALQEAPSISNLPSYLLPSSKRPRITSLKQISRSTDPQ